MRSFSTTVKLLFAGLALSRSVALCDFGWEEELNCSIGSDKGLYHFPANLTGNPILIG